jgi:hypothetical protein
MLRGLLVSPICKKSNNKYNETKKQNTDNIKTDCNVKIWQSDAVS